MKIYLALILVLLPGLTFCTAFIWDKNFSMSCSQEERSFASLSTNDGKTHLFWVYDNHYKKSLIYQVLYPNGYLTNKKALNSGDVYGGPYQSLSTQSSDDGRHILLSYVEYRGERQETCSMDDPNKRGGCLEVLFTESFDGGETWSDPVKMLRDDMDDMGNRRIPSMLLEKDTGRVYVVYYFGSMPSSYPIISIRKPGSMAFEEELVLPRKGTEPYMTLGYTIDRSTNTRYVHMFWTSVSGTALYYSVSTDNGETWTRDTQILSGAYIKNFPAVVMNTRILEGGIYVQSYQGRDVKIMKSTNHGKKWESGFVAGNDMYRLNSLAMCGTNGKGILLSVSEKVVSGVGFVRYAHLSSDKNFMNLGYPFTAVTERTNMLYPVVSCAYIGNNQYSVMFIVQDEYKSSRYFAHGILLDEMQSE